MTFPFANLGPIIISYLGANNIVTIERQTPGSYVNGHWVEGTISTFPMSASVQPAGPKQLNSLPENERTDEAIALYSVVPLLTSDVEAGIASDVVQWAGKRWRVQATENWMAQAGYSVSVATRLGD